MADRVTLTQIAPVAWEHATDRAALQTLRALPGFDEVARKVMGFLGERGIKHRNWQPKPLPRPPKRRRGRQRPGGQ